MALLSSLFGTALGSAAKVGSEAIREARQRDALSIEEFKRYSKELGMEGYEVSAKTSANTTHLLKIMTEHIMKKVDEGGYVPGVRKGIDIRKIEEDLAIQQGIYDKCCVIS